MSVALQKRASLITQLKAQLAAAHDEAQSHLTHWNNGLKCAGILSAAMDEVVQTLFTHATTEEYPRANPLKSEHLCIVATGGYGRQTLAPKSDVDLLFLLPHQHTQWSESVVEWMLYALWDLNLKIGHATRTVKECVRLAKADQTIATAMMDARFLAGESSIFVEFEAAYYTQVMQQNAPTYVAAKMLEREERHTKQGTSRYLVEPNVKEGKGGLRDLQTLVWLVRFVHGLHTQNEVPLQADFTALEWRQFRRAENFLWFMRFHMHIIAGRAEERLSFELQREIAIAMGLKSARGLNGIERLMKHYFLIAKSVGHLTRVVCTSLELQNTVENRFALFTKKPKLTKPLLLVKGQLSHTNLRDLTQNPTHAFSLFAEADKTGLLIHPDAIRAIARSRMHLDEDEQCDAQANAQFLQLLTHTRDPENTLRAVNEAGLLASFLPPFRHVEALMQFNMYHHYTVDEHLIRTVGRVAAMREGTDMPARIFASLSNPRVLLVAALLHDIGKGYPEDHSIKGAEIAANLCPRMGLKPEETELVVWLIRYHLDMSTTAFRRDVNDAKTIGDFVELVQNIERLKLLYLLTIADIQAVGPTTWNSWRADLLATLYAQCELHLGNPEPLAAAPQRIANAQNQLQIALEGMEWPRGSIEAAIAWHNPNYWLKTSAHDQIQDAVLIRTTRENGVGLATRFEHDQTRGFTTWTICAADHPRLLSCIAGACAAQGFNIIGAYIDTTKEGFALDRIYITKPHDAGAIPYADFQQLEARLIAILSGKTNLKQHIQARNHYKNIAREQAFDVPLVVNISNTMSQNFTVIELEIRDQSGLLYDITRLLSTLNLNIACAFVATYGEKAVDAFYVTDLTGQKITSSARIATLKKRIVAELGNL